MISPICTLKKFVFYSFMGLLMVQAPLEAGFADLLQTFYKKHPRKTVISGLLLTGMALWSAYRLGLHKYLQNNIPVYKMNNDSVHISMDDIFLSKNKNISVQKFEKTYFDRHDQANKHILDEFSCIAPKYQDKAKDLVSRLYRLYPDLSKQNLQLRDDFGSEDSFSFNLKKFRENNRKKFEAIMPYDTYKDLPTIARVYITYKLTIKHWSYLPWYATGRSDLSKARNEIYDLVGERFHQHFKTEAYDYIR